MREQTDKLIKRVEEKTDLGNLMVVNAWITEEDSGPVGPYQVEYCAGDLIVSYKGYDNGSESWEMNEGPFASFS